MLLSRRQIVEGGLAAGFLSLAATPVMAQGSGSVLRRRPDMAQTGSNALRMPHPGQPVAAALAPQPAVASASAPVPAQARVPIEGNINPRLVAAARASFDRHRGSVARGDVVGIVDFSKVSSEPRFFLLDTNSGRVTQHFVSHGRGSDPAHTGWLHRFSNSPGSLATSEGAYVTSQYYTGRYGSSMRVRGLDPTNNNAEARAIVIHPAWYAEPSHLATHGRLGRSEGCFAMSHVSLQETLARLGPGHFLYAGRV